MKILILSYSLPPRGGAEKIAWDLACNYSLEHEVHMFVFGNQSRSFKKNNINIHSFKFHDNSLRFYLTKGKNYIINKVNFISPDLIHAHSPTIFAYLLRKIKTKKILTLHNSEFNMYSYSFITKLKTYFFFNSCINNYDYVTTVSLNMTKYFEKKFKKKIYNIPNGIDLNVFYNKNNARKDNSIIFIGQNTKAKGLDKLLNLAKKLSNYSFLIIGNGILKNSIKLPNVEFLGFKNSDEISNYLNISKFAIFPSLYENFPLVGLEAMACGTITFASINSGFNEYIIDNFNGYLIDPNNLDKTTKLFNENHEVLILNAINTSKNFSLNKISKLYLNLIK